MISPTKALLSRRRLLQRDKDFTGDRLTSFRDVFVRHGLPGLTLGLLFLTVPAFQGVIEDALAPVAAHPGRYAAGAVLILLALNAYAWRIDRHDEFRRHVGHGAKYEEKENDRFRVI